LRNALAVIAALLIGLCVEGCTRSQVSAPSPLVGAWRSEVRFQGGVLASVEDLEFLYVFNAGGTLTESSNYDGAPPVPPAYGAWRERGPRVFEAKYEFFTPAPPKSFDELKSGGGWMPLGRGVLVERINLSEDGQSFTSTIQFNVFDAAGNPVEGGGEAKGRGQRIGF